MSSPHTPHLPPHATAATGPDVPVTRTSRPNPSADRIEPDIAQAPGSDHAWRRHAAVLAIGTFVMGTDAFVISGVLPDIADSLHVGIGAAGQLVTVFSIAYALLTPVLTALTTRWSRRTVLVTALIIFAIGNVATAVVPGYWAVLVTRVVAAAGAGLFTANASATASTLAGPAHRGKAISLVMLGITLSLVLGAPLGTVLGNAMGWRATMWCVAALGLLVAPVLLFCLPNIDRVTTRTGLRGGFKPLRSQGLRRQLTITVLAFTGIYIPYTYLSAIFEPATGGGEGGELALLVLAFGIAGTIGNLMAGHLADRRGARRAVLGGLSAIVAVFLVLPALRGSMALAVPAAALTGLVSLAITTPQQQQLIAGWSGPTMLVTSLYQSSLYAAVALAGAVGAGGLAVIGSLGLAPFAAAFVLLAAALSWHWGRERNAPKTDDDHTAHHVAPSHHAAYATDLPRTGRQKS
ncbi:MFS transporter [Embleya sp. NPDC050154]|uniref:MFS transporter n=1 Tax=Embleya sp. NPDC050154 TaxID=3363988 RepID=UPI00379850B1